MKLGVNKNLSCFNFKSFTYKVTEFLFYCPLAPVLYENFYTVQSNQKAGIAQLPSAHLPRAAPRPGNPSLPPTPQQNNGKKTLSHFPLIS